MLHLQNHNTHSGDSNVLFSIFPEEVWYAIFDHAFHPDSDSFDAEEFESLRSASHVFSNLLHPYRVRYMFHNVFQVLTFRYPFLNEETHEFTWKVPNFSHMRHSLQWLAEQQFVCDTNSVSTCPSKWLFGLKYFQEPPSYKTAGIFCQLLETRNPQKCVKAFILVHGASFAGYMCYFRPMVDKTCQINETTEMPFCGWKTKNQMGMGHRQSGCLADGTACYQIKLKTYNPFLW